MRVGAGQCGGHHRGSARLAPTMQAWHGGVDKNLCMRLAAVVGVMNQHRTKFREVAPKEPLDVLLRKMCKIKLLRYSYDCTLPATPSSLRAKLKVQRRHPQFPSPSPPTRQRHNVVLVFVSSSSSSLYP